MNFSIQRSSKRYQQKIPAKAKVKDIFIPKVDFVTVDQKGEEVARIMSKYDLEAIPVVNKKNQLLGRITIDDILNARQCSSKGPTKSQQALWDAEDKRKATLTKAQKDSLEKQKEMFQGNF